jgi:hypothetical protein
VHTGQVYVSCVHTRRQAGATGDRSRDRPSRMQSRAWPQGGSAPTPCPIQARLAAAWLPAPALPSCIESQAGMPAARGLRDARGIVVHPPAWRMERVRSLMDQPQDSFGPLAKGLQLLCSKSLTGSYCLAESADWGIRLMICVAAVLGVFDCNLSIFYCDQVISTCK